MRPFTNTSRTMNSLRATLSASVIRLRALPISVGFAAWAIPASAAPIVITHSGIGSGTLGTNTFVNADFTITENADTANRQSFINGFYIDDTSANIFINGLGTFSFTTGTRTFVEQFGMIVGFSQAGVNGMDLFDGPTNAVFSTWNMLTSVGPVSGNGMLLQWSLLPFTTTTGGQLTFDSANAVPTVFTAAVVPEPAAVTLAALGLGGLAQLRANRRRN